MLIAALQEGAGGRGESHNSPGKHAASPSRPNTQIHTHTHGAEGTNEMKPDIVLAAAAFTPPAWLTVAPATPPPLPATFKETRRACLSANFIPKGENVTVNFK